MKDLELVLHVENEEFVFFFCPVEWVLENQVFDVYEAFLEVVVVQLAISLLFSSFFNVLNLVFFLD